MTAMFMDHLTFLIKAEGCVNVTTIYCELQILLNLLTLVARKHTNTHIHTHTDTHSYA